MAPQTLRVTFKSITNEKTKRTVKDGGKAAKDSTGWRIHESESMLSREGPPSPWTLKCNDNYIE